MSVDEIYSGGNARGEVRKEMARSPLGRTGGGGGGGVLTCKGFFQLDPVLVHKVAVVLPVPEARVSQQRPDVGLQAARRVAS